MHYEPVEGAGAWYGRELARRDDWIRQFSEMEVAEIEAAVQTFLSSKRSLTEMSPAAFALPSLGPALRKVLAELLEGRGFVMLRGLPVGRWRREDQAIAYLGIGSWL